MKLSNQNKLFIFLESSKVLGHKIRCVKAGTESAVTDILSCVNELKESNDSLIVYEINENNEIVKVVFADTARDDEVYNMNNFTQRIEITESNLYRYTTLGGIDVEGIVAMLELATKPNESQFMKQLLDALVVRKSADSAAEAGAVGIIVPLLREKSDTKKIFIC